MRYILIILSIIFSFVIFSCGDVKEESTTDTSIPTSTTTDNDTTTDNTTTDSTYNYFTGSTVTVNFLRSDNSSMGSFWTCVGNKTGTGDYDVYGNKLFINSFTQDSQSSKEIFSGDITKKSPTKFSTIIHSSGWDYLTECNKKNIVPSPPSSLTYANSSSSITLTWTDNQTETVTGYKVLRKTVVTDDFTTVSSITDTTTRTYADTDVSTGSYWYRVRAYNSNGEGIPSKVIKVEFP